MVVPLPPAALHVMAKPTGAICNLDCSYCFFLSKEELYPGSRFRMTDAVLQRIEHTIQTNGTLLDDDWGELLAAHDFLVGISIDGPRELHDAYRVDKGGKPTFDRVLRGLDRLKAHGVRWNVLTTVHHANEEHGLEVYRFLRVELGAAYVQLIPIVERPSPGGIPLGDTVTDRSVSPEGYGRFLVEVFEEWVVRHDVGRVYVQMFDSTLAGFLDVSGSLCVHAETCGKALALEDNGDLYPCDHLVEPAHLLGNITERPLLELVASPQQVAFGNAKRDSLPTYCRRCDVRFACHGGCPKDRFTTTPTASPCCTTCAPATSSSSATSTARCGSWLPVSGPAASQAR